MSFGTREDAELFGKIFAKMVLKIPERYRTYAISSFVLLEIFIIYYLHTLTNKNC